MSGLRFAMVTTFYPPHNFGGDGIAIRRLSRALVRRGHHVTVIYDVDAFRMLHDGPEPEPTGEPDGLEVVGLESALGPVSPLLTHQTGRPVVHGRRIERLLEEGGFDVVHFNNVSLVGGPGVLGAGRGVKLYEAHEHWLVCPTHVLWRHNREPCTGRECFRCVLHHRRPHQLWRYTGLLERQLEHVDAFIAKSEFSRRKHHDFGFPREMEVVPYFLPDAQDREEGARGGPPDPTEPGDTDGDPGSRPAAAGLAAGGGAAPGLATGRAGGDPSPHPRPYFLFVGRLEKIKGLDDVLPHFGGSSGADLLVAGDGEDAARLRELGGDLPRVKFLGRVASEELPRYYRHALALIVPSRCYETFGIVLIEAFRHGTPVIARRIGPFPEIVRRAGAGFLFEEADELREAMGRLEEDDGLRSELAASARRSFAEHWSESAVLPRYLDLVRRQGQKRGDDRIMRILEAEQVA